MFKNKGFTLIELLVVIIIVSILAAISIPMMAQNTLYARGTEGAAIAGSIRTAERIYYSQYPTVGYTNSLADLGITNWTTEYAGKYYDCVSISGGGLTFTANVFDVSVPAEWVTINQSGDWDGTGVRH